MKFNLPGVCILFWLLLYHASPSNAKKKIVKLIVPQKVKYIHHTHVLLVKPSYSKKSPIIREELIEEIPYREESLPSRSRSKVRYILPYYAESKKLSYRLPPEELETSYVPSYLESYRRGTSHEGRLPNRNELQLSEMMEEGREAWPKAVTYAPSYRMPSLQEEPPEVSSDYHTISVAESHGREMPYKNNYDSYTPVDTMDYVPIEAKSYTKPPLDWASGSYSYSSMGMDNDNAWIPNNVSHGKKSVYKLPYSAHRSETYKLKMNEMDGTTGAASAYGYSGEGRSYFRAKTDSYGRSIAPTASGYDLRS